MSKLLSKKILAPHPGQAHPPLDIGVKLSLLGTDVVKLEYVVAGPVSDVLIPSRSDPERTDGLWQHTCFEAFIGTPEGSAYVEYNFSPSSEWAAYRFTGYRAGMAPALDLPAPHIFVEHDRARRLVQSVFVDVSALNAAGKGSIALSAVIETRDGAKSYWALKHPPGKPDFHHPDCFALKLPAAGRE